MAKAIEWKTGNSSYLVLRTDTEQTVIKIKISKKKKTKFKKKISNLGPLA